MSENKFYKKLPDILQTTTVQNFFENTVEQLFSKSKVETINGFIGPFSSDSVNLAGEYLREPTVTKQFYGLSPAVNTVDETSGDSSNFIFYDELIDQLAVYGVDVRDHNKIFAENYSTFLPPVDTDKLLNFAEYYWYPEGPTAIEISGTAEQPINVERDILGQASYTSPTGVTLRNGMIVTFVGDYMIPQSIVGTEYIVEGVGSSMMLISRDNHTATNYVQDQDYLVQQRGASNQNTWSRVNFWFHKQNFVDAGDELPLREFRADRPIIEFDRDLELYNYSDDLFGTVDLASTEYTLNDLTILDANATIDGVNIVGKEFLLLSEPGSNASFVYTASTTNGTDLIINRKQDTNLNDISVSTGQVVQIREGDVNAGLELVWDGTAWQTPQQKTQLNQAPLFNLYDNDGVYLGDTGVYPGSTFAGNPIFGYAQEVPLGSSDTAVAPTDDPVLGQPLVYRQFKASSEILFQSEDSILCGWAARYQRQQIQWL
jgi:hypothetical protein